MRRLKQTIRALDSIELADNIKESNEKLQCLTLLYALFEKFGDELSRKKFKEVIGMTEIGKMIREEGLKEGKAEGKAEILIKQLIKKFKTVPNEYREKIKQLPEETIDIIATDIIELEKVEEVERYF